VVGDRWGGEFPRERLKIAGGIGYTVADKTTSEVFLALLPLLNSRQVELLDPAAGGTVARMYSQLNNLERRSRSGAREVIGHPQGANHHDDVITSAALALVLAHAPKKAPQLFFFGVSNNPGGGPGSEGNTGTDNYIPYDPVTANPQSRSIPADAVAEAFFRDRSAFRDW
jgi:hypothetical protein